MPLKDRVQRFWDALRFGMRASSVEMIAWEHRELENVFALMLFAPAAGVPASPGGLSLDLLPWLERELLVLLDRARESGDPMGELFSTFDVS